MKVVNIQSGAGSLDKCAVVLTADQFEDLEVLVPYFRLLEEGAKVDIAAPTLDEIEGEHGYRLMPDLTFDQVRAPDGAPATVRDNALAQSIAASFFEKNKPVATICHGPWLLVSSNVVKDRHLTSYWHDGVPQDVAGAGGLWEDRAVVVDGNLVSSRWPPNLPAFNFEMMKVLRS
jgi:protease I